jgi:TPR repeat protein
MKMKQIASGLMVILSLMAGISTNALELDYRALKQACDSFDAEKCNKQMIETDPVTLFFYGKDEVGKKNIFVSTDAICLSAEMGLRDGAAECIRQAKLGNSVAQFHVGRLLGLGIGLEQNYELSYMWLHISAQKGHGPAVGFREFIRRTLSDAEIRSAKLAANTCLQTKYADCKAGIKIKSNENETFVQNLFRKANNGDAYSMYLLGAVFSLGDGVVKDENEAAKWYRLAAEQGEVNGQVNIAYFYEMGIGVVKDPKEAVKWYRLAAEQGNATAQNNLGMLYDYGEGVVKDPKEAAKWYRLAAEQGKASSQLGLGRLYFYGEGVLQDQKEAAKWYRLSAEQGNKFAQSRLGAMYERGKGVLQDYREAARWYRLAAEQGHAFSQTRLGLLYDFGDGVVKDPQEAVKWYRLAAEQGNASGQFNLGIMYALAKGVIKDDVIAHMWLNIASSNGIETAAESRGTVEEGMTPSQIAEAQKLARECVAREYKGC